MRRWVLVGALLAIALGLVVVVGLQRASAYLTTHRARVAATIGRAVGRPVTLGRIGVSIGGGLGVRVDDVRVGDDPAYSSEPFAEVRAVRVVVRLLPALLGRVEIRRLVIDEPTLTIIGGRRGRNVDSLMPSRSGRAGEGPAPAATASSSEAGAGLAVGLVRVRGGRIRVVDSSAGTTIADVGEIDGTLTDVTAAGPAMLRLRGTTTVAPGGLADLRRALPELGTAVPAALAADGRLDLEASYDARATQTPFDVVVDATRAAVTWGDSLAKPAGVPVRLTLSGRRVQGATAVDALTLRLAEHRITGRGRLDGSRLEAHLEAAPAPLRPLAAMLPALAPWSTDGTAGFAVDVRGRPGTMPDLTGVVQVRALSLDHDAHDLRVRGFDADVRLAGDAAELPPTAFEVSGLPLQVQGRIGPFAAPGVVATLETSGGRLNDLVLERTSAELRYQDAVATIPTLDLGVFGGRVRGRVRIDGRRVEPDFDLALELDDIDLEAAAAASLPALARLVSGLVSGSVELAGRGTAWETLRPTLRGRGSLEGREGVLRAVNVGERVLSAVTGLPGLTVLVPPDVRRRHPELFGASETRFDELAATWRLATGVVDIERVALAAREYAVRGRGRLELLDRLDLTAVLTLSESLSQDIVREVSEARLLADADGSLVVPFRVAGHWPSVTVTPDASALTRRLGAGALRTGVEELLGSPGAKSDVPSGADAARDERTRPDTGDLIRRGLEGLLGR